jgi:hypothetical protein
MITFMDSPVCTSVLGTADSDTDGLPLWTMPEEFGSKCTRREQG